MTTVSVTLSCLECGRDFEARRAHARFCSANCRKRNSRRKENIQRAAAHALSQIAEIRRLAARYPDTEIVAALALEKIANSASLQNRDDGSRHTFALRAFN
jgi:hypothetical protein